MRLLEPLHLGGRVAPNRIVFGPHETNLGHNRSSSPRALAYYERRAAGGAGTIVLEPASVHESDWPYERAPLASHSQEGWTSIARAIHAHGALALASLNHAGGQGSSAYSQQALLAPSRVPEVNTREVPKSMEKTDIEEVIASFVNATRLALSCGLDGVEINAGQHSLIRQFLSGLTNQRGDEWGENRLLFATRVLEEVRSEVDAFAAIGPRPIVGLRLSCDELAPWAGIVPDHGAEIAAALSPWVDYITVVRGSIYSVAATRPDCHVPPGFNVDLIAQVRAAVPETVAIMAQGSIVELDMAEKLVDTGVAELVEMTRAQIADPDLVAKAVAGEVSRIRPCILCNQNCSVRDNRNPIVSCVGEPSAGHELEDPPTEGPAHAPTSVLVVGGGVTGMEAARVAASRGHSVRLVERSSNLGGAIRIGAQAPGRERLVQLANWLESECRTLGVKIDLDTQADEEMLESSQAVILSTGARDGVLSFEVDLGSNIVRARSLLDTHLDKGLDGVLELVGQGPVLIWDPIGGPIAISVAELLAPHRSVELVTHDQVVGNLLARSGDMGTANVRLHGAGVTLHKRSLLRKVTHGSAEIEAIYSGVVRRLDISAVVACGHELPNDALWRSTGERHVVAGDAVAPRTLHEAVLEGRRAALSIEGLRG